MTASPGDLRPGAPRAVAAFDFDGTLTRRDSLTGYLRSVAGNVALLAAAAVEARHLGRAALGRGSRDEAKARLLRRLLADRSIAQLRAAGHAHAGRLVHHGLRPTTRERLEWHRDRGDLVVVVSASLDVYLDDVGRRLGLDAVLCTTMGADGDRCTGELIGGNCRGPEKAVRLSTYLRELGAVDEVWGYGDSAGDDEMLALVDRPHRVSRTGRIEPARDAP